jgi:CRISPR-associated helicase Cas3
MTFDQLFHAATGHAPFRWQKRLYGQFLEGNLPAACKIPTGLGKTSVIPIWLLALAEQLNLKIAVGFGQSGDRRRVRLRRFGSREGTIDFG